MPCDSCQRLGDATLGVLGLLVLACVGLNTTSLLWLHLRPRVQHLLRLLTPKLEALSRPAPPARPRSPPVGPDLGRRPCPGPRLTSRRPPAGGPPGLEMERPWAHPGAPPTVPHGLGGPSALRPAHRTRVYLCPLSEGPGWTPPPPSSGGVTSEGWWGDCAGVGVPLHPPSPSFAGWNREGSGVLR